MTSAGTGSMGSNEQPVHYKKASTVNASQEGLTTPAPESQRSVATCLTEGKLAIRYTPRDIPPPSGETR